MSKQEFDVMVVEDSLTQAHLLQSCLAQEGYTTRVAHNGLEAIGDIHRQAPSIVISDIEMPEMDGYELCNAIKSDQDLCRIPVILLSWCSDPTDIIKGLQVGADNYVTKPYATEFLLSRVAALLHTPLLEQEVAEGALEVTLDGKQYEVKSGRQQALNLLVSTFENAVQKNRELKKVNDELIAAQKQLTVLVEAERKANNAKSAFLANMSHELRTPMNAIIGYSELLEEELEDAGQQDFIPDLQKIHASGIHLLGLINDILDVSKIEAGKMDVLVDDFDLSVLLSDVCSTVQPLMRRKGNDFQLSGESQLGEMRSDQTKIRQCLLNLLSNAAKFTDQGSVTLHVERVHREGHDWFNFTVSDTGIGITEEQLKIVFEAFSQAEESTSRRFGGTGLGLTITRRFAEMMQGDLIAESVQGKGTQFKLRLPAVYRDSCKMDAQSVEIQSGEYVPDSGEPAPSAKTILVIDDEASARELLARYLTIEGFRVFTAVDGLIGIEMAKELRPSLITLDLMMPSVDGWTVLETLKSQPETSSIPIIIVSMLDDSGTACKLGAREYLTKPIERQALMHAVARAGHENAEHAADA